MVFYIFQMRGANLQYVGGEHWGHLSRRKWVDLENTKTWKYKNRKTQKNTNIIIILKNMKIVLYKMVCENMSNDIYNIKKKLNLDILQIQLSAENEHSQNMCCPCSTLFFFFLRQNPTADQFPIKSEIRRYFPPPSTIVP